MFSNKISFWKYDAFTEYEQNSLEFGVPVAYIVKYIKKNYIDTTTSNGIKK